MSVIASIIYNDRLSGDVFFMDSPKELTFSLENVEKSEKKHDFNIVKSVEAQILSSLINFQLDKDVNFKIKTFYHSFGRSRKKITGMVDLLADGESIATATFVIH